MACMRDSQASTQATPPAADRSRFTVLVVDDTESARYAMARVLRAAGYKTLEAASGAQALRLAAQASAVILDVHLPDVYGLDVCRMLRRGEKTAHMPIIQVSAVYTEPNDSCAAHLAGADTYLVNPVPPDDLVAAVDALLAKTRPEAAQPRASSRKPGGRAPL
jgi:DNA-binding response OmpR family regulator